MPAAFDTPMLPLEQQGLTATVTTPEIYALGSVTTAVSFRGSPWRRR